MNISRYANIEKFVNIQYIFLLARRAYSWLFQLAQMWKLLAPGVGLVDFLTPVNIWLHNILCDFFYPFKTQGRIILGCIVLLSTQSILFNFRYKKIKTYG